MPDPLALATLGILGVTAYTSYRAFNDPRIRDALIFCPLRILRDKEYHRVVTSGFIHADWTHFGFNMFSLYSFGSYVEAVFGAHVLLLIYFASIVGGSLLSLFLHRHHDYRALGASGGVCGVIFATIFLLPGGGVYIFPLPIAIPSWLYAILFIVVSFFGMRSGRGDIGHDAHLGGALVGLAVATLLRPAIIQESPVLYGTVVAISVALFFYAYRAPLHLQTSDPLTRRHWRDVWSRFRRRADARDRAKDARTMDALLDRISRSGIESLSADEKARLTQIAARRTTDDRTTRRTDRTP